MLPLEFARYTEKIRNSLPYWFEMNKYPNTSAGMPFLNIFGKQLDKVEEFIEYGFNQLYIDTVDVECIDICYKAILPSHIDANLIYEVLDVKNYIPEARDLYTFFNIDKCIHKMNNIGQPHYYYLDTQRKIIYVRFPYQKNNDDIYGKITINYDGEYLNIPLVLHHVWNFLDEFGALLSCGRLQEEHNLDYKNRILDVFNHPANSTKFGLANGISRELGLRSFKIWEDTTEPFIIKDKMVIVNTIEINGEVINLYDMTLDENDNLIIGPYDENIGPAKVTYIRGLEMQPLNDLSDPKISNELINSDGSHTIKMKKFIREIRNNSSIIWGDFKYDEAYWNKDNEYDNVPYGFEPSKLDANISGFEKYESDGE